MRKLYLYSFIFFLSAFLFNCTPEEDSKPAFFQNHTSELQYNHLWETFYFHLDGNNPDSALYYADSIHAISTNEENKKWLAKSSKAKGYVFSEIGKIKEAISYYLIAVNLFSEIGDLKNQADVFINLGTEFYSTQDYETGISFYTKAEGIYHYEGASSERAIAFRGLAQSYKKLNKIEKAEAYLKLGKEAAENGKDYYNLGLFYNTWAMLKLEQKNFDQAYKYLLLTLQFSDSLKETTNLKAIASNNIGEVFFQKEEYEKAKEWLRKAIVEKNKLNDPILAQSSYLLLSKILIKEHKHEEAIALLEEGLQKIPPGTTHTSINESLTLINEALIKVNKDATPSEYPEFNKKLITYSQRLIAYNQNVSETKERLETISKQQDIQDAMEKHALNEQIAAYEQRNTYLQYSFLIPVFFLICAIVSIYLSMRRNMEYKKLYKRIEETINSNKSLRHLNKK